MSTLDSIFNAKPAEGLSNPTVRYDYKNGESLKLRFGNEFNELILLVRHFVEGVGYVRCNQKPVKLKDGRIGIFGECEFCATRKAFKLALTETARKENRELTKEESEKTEKVNKRTIHLIAQVEVEVRRGRDVVKPLEPKAILLRASDMFFDHLNQHYKVLSQVYENKGTIKKNWFTLSGKGALMIDDKCEAKELETPIEVDISFYDKQAKSYQEGLTKLKTKMEAVNEATPMDAQEADEVIIEEPPRKLTAEDVVF